MKIATYGIIVGVIGNYLFIEINNIVYLFKNNTFSAVLCESNAEWKIKKTS